MTGNEPGASEIEDGTEAVDPRSARRQRTAPVPTIRERTVSGTLSHNFKCDVMSAADMRGIRVAALRWSVLIRRASPWSRCR